jgi:hypothetical protein
VFEDITFTVGQVSLISIASWLCGFLINHWLAIGRDRRKERRDAGREFRNAFLEIQRLLEINPPKDPAHPPDGWQNTNKLVRKFYKEHHSAIIRFEPLIPWYKKRCFRKRWHEYCCYDKKNDYETFADYEPDQPIEELDKRRLAVSRIKRLLRFARV